MARHRTRAPLALALAALVLAACAGVDDGASGPAVPTATGGGPRTTGAPPPPGPTTSATDPPVDPGPPPPPSGDLSACAAQESAGQGPVPVEVRAALDGVVGDPRWQGLDVGISVWVDGWGEVLAVQPDQPLLPASVEKLLPAVGALAVLGPEATLATTVRGSPPVDGVVPGDLVLVGGGDPLLGRDGPTSLAALADRLRAAGVRRVSGAVVVDDSRHDGARTAPGWLSWQQPAFIGPMSALLVDQNRWRRDPAYVADPTVGNGEAFVAALGRAGIVVAGPVRSGVAGPSTPVLAEVRSAPVGELVAAMLGSSDNTMAEALVREVGVVGGAGGSTAGGLAVIDEVVGSLLDACGPPAGVATDGSGLSRLDARSAREWRRLLQAVRSQPWGPGLLGGLPVAGASGTLAHRLSWAPAAGNVRAKTGTTIPARALAGEATTGGGRTATFAVIVNGADAVPPGQAEAAIDALASTVAGLPG